MESVEELCDNIALINKSHLVITGGVNDIRHKYGNNNIELIYTGEKSLEPMEGVFSVLSDIDNAGRHTAVVSGTWTNGLTMGLTNAYDSYYLANPYLQMIKSGKVGEEELNDKARRVLRLMFRTNMNPEHKTGKFTSPEHSAAARKIGAEGIVLLKNEGGLLPLGGVKKGYRQDFPECVAPMGGTSA